MSYASLKGFRDILPEESARWRAVEGKVHDLMRRYGYGEVRLPMLEPTELFVRGVGEGTDVVGKEMYSFLDRSDPPESITLRPELTASAARTYVQHSMAQQQALTAWYYVGPAFRYEQPQAGRYRQFHTFGVELIGSEHPEADAEVIAIGADLLDALGITNFRLRINSLGMPDERAIYRTALLDYLRDRVSELSEESVRRMEGNPLRVLDSKKEQDIRATVDAPRLADYLGAKSLEHFERTRALLDDMGIAYTVDGRLVRGLDYYTRTAFEFQGLDLGAQDALGGGGRYDGLIEQVGGKPTPAVGFGFGMERLLLAAETAGAMPTATPQIDAYVIGLDDEARRWAVQTVHTLRRAGLRAECDLLRRSMKAQMRDANRRGARFAVIVGSNELAAGAAQVKNLGDGSQRDISFDTLVRTLCDAEPGAPPTPLPTLQ